MAAVEVQGASNPRIKDQGSPTNQGASYSRNHLGISVHRDNWLKQPKTKPRTF
jgi:hypothetical protein